MSEGMDKNLLDFLSEVSVFLRDKASQSFLQKRHLIIYPRPNFKCAKFACCKS